jgi:hypothetical protein
MIDIISSIHLRSLGWGLATLSRLFASLWAYGVLF